ncbi:glucose/galactose transporter family protein [Photobacterium profundum 3TCK]|uniref:Glucose/galactose transporter family protein n=2 Tax=Photobacterium profundum TaxID=74109 RepID=Q1ZB46_9GAMM|nr:glucose/galactose transporter family protein [Photobacterium profundum 3TCK]
MLVQIAFYLAPFVTCIPCSQVMNRLGYKVSLSLSLLLAAVGGCSFSFAIAMGSFTGSLVGIFVIALGVAAMQVVANPYVTQIGEVRTASRRLTFTSSINSLGTTLAPLILGITLASAGVENIYLILSVGLLLLSLLTWKGPLQDVRGKGGVKLHGQLIALTNHKPFLLGAVTIFVYVGVEVAIGTVTISYLSDKNIVNLTSTAAASLISLYWAGSMVGRFAYSFLGRKVESMRALFFSALLAVLLIILAMFNGNVFGAVCLIAIGLCNSFMYPVIFYKSIEGLKDLTSSGSAVLVMCSVGGGIVPFVQASLIDHTSIPFSYIVPLLGYLIIASYGLYSKSSSSKR